MSYCPPDAMTRDHSTEPQPGSAPGNRANEVINRRKILTILFLSLLSRCTRITARLKTVETGWNTMSLNTT